MLRPFKTLTVLLVCCLFLFIALLSLPPTSLAGHRSYSPRHPSLLRNGHANNPSIACASLPPPQQEEGSSKVIQAKLKIPSITSDTKTPNSNRKAKDNRHRRRSQHGSKVSPDAPRYLMYVPYAGVTNQLISIWHGSMIAKALNRTLLIPNLSPNVHVTGGSNPRQRQGDQGPSSLPTTTRWSEFFDLEYYSQQTGLRVEELDTFLEKRGIVERSTMPKAKDQLKSQELQTKRTATKKVQRNRRRWVQLGSASQDVHSSSNIKRSMSEEPKPSTPRSMKYPTVPKCFSEAGYGFDRRIDMTGRLFMQRYNMDPALIPTPFVDPDNDNKNIWTRWRMDKVVERYQQPEYEYEEILCIGHVYRLLPGGIHRAWVEFGQYFRYTKHVETFVDDILDQLLPSTTMDRGDTSDQNDRSDNDINHLSYQDRSFIGVHLRRGDFKRHCLGITSPADPNGWNRCYPSTGHIISLLNTYGQGRAPDQWSSSVDSRPSYTHSMSLLKRQYPGSSPGQHSLQQQIEEQHQREVKNLPVLVLTNERDPEELSKADDQNWIRVDHERLGTLDRYGEYGPILIDGALLARANLLVGVEYSTYFKTAGKRAEAWYGGRTLFVT